MLPTSLDRSAVDGQLAAARAELEARVRAGRAGSADDLKDSFPDVWADPEAALELVYAEFVFRTAAGEAPDPADWYRRYPHWSDRLERLFALYDLMRGRETHGFRTDGTVGDEDDPGDGPPPGRHPPGYEILGEIGRGGMAVVFKARQVALNRVVALKVLRGGWLADEDRGRVRREAMAAARLQHPHVAQIHEVGEWAGAPFLTLEYVPGGTLADVLARSQRQGAVGVTPARAAELMETLARTMHAAHELGIVHRDLKPANILLAGDPTDPLAGPKIADFGLAVTVDRSAVDSHTATLAGTPCYMAPEQADCRRAAVGPRTDVYALGGLLYELLTGRPPVQGATVLETLDLVRTADPVAPRLLSPNTPRDLETVCLKCLRKSPDQRYPSAAALADDLRAYLDGRPITARPVSAAERGMMWARRHPQVAALAAAVVLLVGTVLAVTTSKWRASEAAREREAGLRQTAEQGEQREADLRHEAEGREARLLLKTARLQWVSHDLAGAREALARCPEDHRPAEWRALWRACRPPVRVMPRGSLADDSPNHGASKLVYSPDGRHLAARMANHSVTVWEVDSGREVYAHKARGANLDVAFPDDARLVISDSRDDGGRVPAAATVSFVELELATRRAGEVRRFARGGGRAYLLSADGRYGAHYSALNQLRVFDLNTGAEKAVTIPGVTDRNFQFAQTGHRLITTAVTDRTRVWDAATLAEVKSLPLPEKVAPQHSRLFAALSPDGTRLVLQKQIEGDDGELVFRDLNANKPDRVLYFTGESIRRPLFSPDGRLVAAWLYRRGYVGVWEFDSGREVFQIRGYEGQATATVFSPDGKRLAVGYPGWEVVEWDVSADAP